MHYLVGGCAKAIFALVILLGARPALSMDEPDTSSPATVATPIKNSAHEIVSAPDRPNVASAADVTERGILELEYGWTRQWLGRGLNGNSLNGRFRFGVTENLDVSWSTDDFLQAPGSGKGLGDSVVGARYRFVRQSGSRPSFAVVYRCKIPIARESNGLGTGYADHQLAFLTSKDFGKHHLDFNAIETFNGGHRGFMKATGLALAYSHALTGPLGSTTEFSGTVSPDGTAVGTEVLTFRVRPRLVVDAGIDFGITPGVPRKRLLVGMTYAIGRLLQKAEAGR